MATTNTTKSWHYYIRKKGKNWVIGLVDDAGAATTSALALEVWYDEIPDEITSDNDDIPIPSEFEHAFAMGCVEEILRMNGKRFRDFRRSKLGHRVNSFRADFEDGIYDAIHKQVQESQQPATIWPYDLRMDDFQINTRSPEK
jgi:hypothetical protein